MLVCHCRAVNDRRIHAEIDRGARCDVDVALACGAGAECGGCLPAVNRLLDQRLGCSAGDSGISLAIDAAGAPALG